MNTEFALAQFQVARTMVVHTIAVPTIGEVERDPGGDSCFLAVHARSFVLACHTVEPSSAANAVL